MNEDDRCYLADYRSGQVHRVAGLRRECRVQEAVADGAVTWYTEEQYGQVWVDGLDQCLWCRTRTA